MAEVIELHAGMVWGVCSQVLRRREDIEDAFQATFLILARKGKSIRAADSAAGWLYRVAFRTALLARTRRNRLAERPLEYEPASSDDDQLEAIARKEQCRVLLEELHALPLQYRQPLVLCYLEGRSRSEAADELGVTPQSVKGRLARGTRMLRSRMAGRGVALSTTMAITAASITAAQAATPPTLISNTAALAASFASKLAGAGAKATAAKAAAATLAEKGMLSMTLVSAAKPAVAVLGICLTAGMFAIASADAPKGEGSGGAAVMLLASADAEEAEDAAENQPADVVIAAAEEREGGEQTIDEVIAKELSVQVDGKTATIRAGGPAEKEAAPVDASSATTEAANPAAKELPGANGGVPPFPVVIQRFEPSDTATGAAPAPADPAAPAAGFQPPRTSAASAFVFADSSNPFAAAGDRLDFVAAPQTAQFRMDFNNQSLPRVGSASEKSLKLEQEYWDLKAHGLKLKADAMQLKAKVMEESGGGAQAEVLELRAEVGLIQADLKLCEINTQRVKEQLEAIVASQLKRGSKGVEVRMLQQTLNEMLKPSPKLEVDGDFGFLTEEAVKLFQKANKLEATGVVDEKTAAALKLRIRLPGAPADVLIPNPLFSQQPQAPTPPPVEAKQPYGGGGVIFGGRGGSDLQLERERALARAREAAQREKKAHDHKAEVDARRQQIKALQDALEVLQQQQKAVEDEAQTNVNERPSAG